MAKVKNKIKDKNHRPFLTNKHTKQKAIMDTVTMSNSAVAQKYGVDQSTISRLKADNKDHVEFAIESFTKKNLEKLLNILCDEVNAVANITSKAAVDVESVSEKELTYKRDAQRNTLNFMLQKMGIYPTPARVDVNVNTNVSIVSLMLEGEERLKEIAVKPAE